MYYLLVAKVAKKVPVSFFNPWMIASIVELLIILILIILLFKKKKKKPDDFYVGESIKEYKDAEVDFGNMFNSMFNASTLHDALKRKIHPDRFPNDEEKIKAECIEECGFLFNYYTDLFNRIRKDEIDLSILFKFIDVLKLTFQINLRCKT
jgi:Sec-independent protein translocase protein TatA